MGGAGATRAGQVANSKDGWSTSCGLSTVGLVGKIAGGSPPVITAVLWPQVARIAHPPTGGPGSLAMVEA